jgi:hypothetical protein
VTTGTITEQDSKRAAFLVLSGAIVAGAVALLAPAVAVAAASTPLNRSNNTPFPSSKLITGASWTTAAFQPPTRG